MIGFRSEEASFRKDKAPFEGDQPNFHVSLMTSQPDWLVLHTD